MVAKVSNKQGASPKSFQNKLERHDRKTQIVADLIVIVICLAVLFLLDSVLDSSSMIFVVLKKTAVYAVVAVSMNLLNGFTGLFSLGQAGFMLIGAYTYGILMIPSGDRASVYQYFNGGIVKFSLQEVFAGIFGGNAGVGMFFGVLIALILAGVFAALFAFLIGLPVLRLKGDYLAIATLGFAEIIRALFQWNTIGGLTNGSNMLRKFPSFDSIVAGWAAGSPFVSAHIPFFSTLLPMIIAAICISLIVMLIHSSYGRSFKAIRDDEVAAEAMGINLAKHKMLAFCTSSFFAGIGGAMLAMFQTTIQANAFKSSMTYEILLIVVIGGIGSVTGSILGAFLFVAASEWWLRFLDTEMVFADAGTKTGFVIFAVAIVALLAALVIVKNRGKEKKDFRRIAIIAAAVAFIVIAALINYLVSPSMNVPLLRSGFRLVVFSLIIMIIVLFYRRGIMGSRELNWDSVTAFFMKRRNADKEGGEKA